jgi:hypothetical protein
MGGERNVGSRALGAQGHSEGKQQRADRESGGELHELLHKKGYEVPANAEKKPRHRRSEWQARRDMVADTI